MKEVAIPVSQVRAKQMEVFAPSIATMQLSVIMEFALMRRVNVCLVGEGSCGKSSLMRELIDTQLSRFASLDMVSTALFARASLKSFQTTIEDHLERKRKDVYAPQGGRMLIVAIEDLNMP